MQDTFYSFTPDSIIVAAAQTTRRVVPTTRSAANLKTELIQRAAQLQVRVRAEIQKLVNEKREHLSELLKEEDQRVERLVGELKEATDSVRLAFLESELIDAEYRVENEVNILQRETASQDLLVSAAKVLKEWVAEELKTLRAESGNRAKEAARLLEREEQQLEQIAERLNKAQDQRTIEVIEVELRAIEVRLYEALRALRFQPSTQTPPRTTRPAGPTTKKVGTTEPTRPTTRGPVTARPTTRGPVTVRPTTRGPVTARPTTRGPVTARPTTRGPVTAGPTTGRPVTAGPTTRRPVTVAPTGTRAPVTATGRY